MKKIKGRGGDDSAPTQQQHVPTNTTDNINTYGVATLVDVLCEGEIIGLADGAKSIYLDETPLQNANGSFNFAKVTYDFRFGTQGQNYMQGYSEVETQIQLDLEVTNASPIIRSITDLNADKVRANFYMPSLQNINPVTGDILGNHLSIQLEVSNNGGPFVITDYVNSVGKSSNPFGYSLIGDLPSPGPWEVRFSRPHAPDDSTQYYQHRTFIQSYDEIILSKLRYPNTAYIGITFDANQFSAVPARYYDLKLMIIKVPTNYNPVTRAYSGTWDGTFKTAWSDNPAWCFYDLITNTRYGCGIAPAQIDKWTLYQIAKYCDELVPDGFGGYEPRFTCNLLMNDRAEAYTIVQNMASIFRSMVYWSAGAIYVSQDSPQDAAQLFTTANVVDGKFNYSGASTKARHTAAIVAWNDPKDFYRSKAEYVEDQVAIARFGVNTLEVAAFGCTSRGQANRLGKWILYTEQNESETVTFQTGLEGIVGRPGQVIKVADPSRAGNRMGGRLVDVSTPGEVTVDSYIGNNLSGGTLSIFKDDGTVEARTIIGQSGRRILVQPAFSSAHSVGSIWIAEVSSVLAQTFRIISVSENQNGTYAITALKHDPNKFAAVEQNLILQDRDITDLKAVTEPPSNLKITEALYQTGTEVKSKVILSWDRVTRAAAYSVKWGVDSENFVEVPATQFNQIEVLDTRPGTYSFYVTAINSVGKRSAPTSGSKEVFGKTTPPVNVSGFSMLPNQGQAYLTWDRASDLDVLVGGQIRIRHTPRVADQSWKDAVDIIPAVAGTATSAVAPLLAGTYMAKFVDSSGFYSVTEAAIVTVNPQAIALNLVDTQIEEPLFTGVKDEMTIDTLTGALVLASEKLIDDIADIDALGSFDFPGGIVTEGYYYFANVVDLGSVYPARIVGHIDLEAFVVGSKIDERTQLIDEWADIDGETVNDVNAELQVATTNDDPSGSPVWSEWKRVHTGAYTGRAFKYRLKCTSGNESHNLYIKELSVTLDMEDRAVSMGPLTTTTGIYTVTYADPFRDTPSISVTASNMATGDFFTITDETELGFKIQFKNSAGTGLVRTFSLIAKGYGRKVA